MGSYCTIYFDELEICSAKSAVPDEFSAIFQESDRQTRTSQYEDDDTPDIVYQASRNVVLSRLALLGYTSQIARDRLAKWILNERTTWKKYADYGDWAAETAEAIRNLTVEEWYERIPQVLAMQFNHDEPIDAIGRYMRDDEWLWFDGYESLAGLRALLDANPQVEQVTLDVSDLIHGGWLDANDSICLGHRNGNIYSMAPSSPIVVLAEGRSDISILKRSLSILFPERKDYFSFFEHDELSVDGGTAYLVKFLKAFAAARTPLRLMAIFDNDTAGRQAHRHAQSLGLPNNMILLRLPDTDLAKQYPTVGPQGYHAVGINGKAASIELYLGRSALTVNGQLRPVRWTSYNAAADAYQGEVEAKDEVKRIFFQQLATFSNSMDAQHAFPELVSVWMSIFRAVERSAEEAEKK